MTSSPLFPDHKMTNTDEVPAAKKARVETAAAGTNPLKNEAVQAATQASIQQIEELEDELNQIEDKQSEAIIKLEQEYVTQKVPVYEKRAEQIKKIPQFWYKAISQHPQIYCLIEDRDQEALQSLTEVYVNCVSKDLPSGQICEHTGEEGVKTLNFAITFKFSANAFFENTEITKSFYQLGEEVVSENTEIKWKEGKNLTQMKNKVENGNAAAGGDDEGESFFAWFSDHDNADQDETADVIKDDLYLHALNYYLNEDDSEDEEEDGDDDKEIDLATESDEE